MQVPTTVCAWVVEVVVVQVATKRENAAAEPKKVEETRMVITSCCVCGGHAVSGLPCGKPKRRLRLRKRDKVARNPHGIVSQCGSGAFW